MSGLLGRRRTDGQPVRRRRDLVHDVEVASIVAGPDSSSDDSSSDDSSSDDSSSDDSSSDDSSSATGAGPVLDVVLVHGLGVSNRYLVPALRAFAREHRVFAPDLPGVGRSSRPERDLSMVELADGLRDWMDVVGVGPAVLVGHSLGSQVVAQLAARHPDRVVGVVLACPAPDPGRGSALEQGWRLLRDGFRERPAMAFIAATDYPRVGVGGMLRGLRAAARRRDQPNLQAVAQPTLLIHGGRDLLVSAGWVEDLAARFADASVVTLPEAPHGVPLSAVEAFVGTVHDFVDRVGRAWRADGPDGS